ncbi:MAG: glycosyltransferase family 4 protein [Halioglobus sp.]|nr:glycosyltransferase family 4 protein [Halioglobus sp.]
MHGLHPVTSGVRPISSNQHKATRLWLTSPHFYPTYGGAQNRYRSYIPGLLARGLDVRVMTGTPQIQERSEADSDKSWYDAAPGTWLPQITLDGAPLERIRLPDSKNRTRTQIYYDALLDVCQRERQGPTVAQLLTNMRPQALPWLRRLKDSGVATVYSVSQFPTWQQKPVKRILRRRGYQQVYNAFDALVTNSQAIEEFLRSIGVTTRIEYIPNGVNLQRFHPSTTAAEREASTALREKFGIPAEHKVIVAVGAIMPRKGPDKILQAWRRILPHLPDTHVMFVGPRADTHDPKLQKFGEEIEALVAGSGAAHQVHFTGIVDDVENYLRAADVFILASNREGTPNSVLEAMATGLPCLVTPFLGISAGIGQPGEHYQLVEREPEAIAAALTGLLQNDTLATAYAERGQRYVVDNVDQQLSLDRYVALYQELAAAAQRR